MLFKTVEYFRFSESMRIYPPVPFVARTLQNELQMGEHLLPKGTTIVIPQMFVHHNYKVSLALGSKKLIKFRSSKITGLSSLKIS
jgi:hypothetical protein